MVGQNSHQLVLVLWLQQFFNRSFRQLGERLVSRGEYGEWPFTLECLHQTSGLHGSNQGLEGTSLHSRVNDVSLLNSSCGK